MAQVIRVNEQFEQLKADLAAKCTATERQAKSFHFWLMVLTGLTIAASAAAGLLGLGFGIDTRIVGAVALIPGIAASIIQQFRMPAKIDFHYRKGDRLNALLRKARYEMPPNPTPKQVGELSRALSDLERGMLDEWQQVVGQTPRPEQLRSN
jgi:hypothetical protein